MSVFINKTEPLIKEYLELKQNILKVARDKCVNDGDNIVIGYIK